MRRDIGFWVDEREKSLSPARDWICLRASSVEVGRGGVGRDGC